MVIVFLLLQAGVLHQAARECKVDRMKEILAQKLSLNDSGRTALHVAIDSRKVACVSLMLVAGADPKVPDQEGRTAIVAGEMTGDQRIQMALKTLTQKAGGEGIQGPVPRSLESSVSRKQGDVTKLLLAMGADPNMVGSSGTTPLAEASLKGDIDAGDSGNVIKELAKQGADLNARSRDESQTPLHFAAAMGKIRAVEALVDLERI